MKKIILIIIVLLCHIVIFGQCTNSTPYGSATAPTNGATVTITTVQYATEYATISLVTASTSYQSTSSIATDYLTVRKGTYNGAVIASGITPLIWTSTGADTYYVHCNTNSSCGTASSSRTTTISHIITVPSSGNNSVTTCSGHIYDNGGSVGTYSANSDGYTVIYPGIVGNKIQLTGTYCTESGFDYIYIYDGVGTGGMLLFTGSISIMTSIGTITSTDPSGSLTIRFTSDGSIQNSGFDFNINCTINCTPVSTPYSQDFESSIVPIIPLCNSIENVGNGNNWSVVNNPGYGFTSNTLRYKWNTTYPANCWFYTNGVNLINGVIYRLNFRYGNSGGTTFPEKLKVKYGTNATNIMMVNTLYDNSNVTNSTPILQTIDFIPSSTGVFYFGFNSYSNADMFYLFIDDISITKVNMLPIELLSFDVLCEHQSALIQWSTASEINNSHFLLQRSEDAINFETFKIINGSGNSNQVLNYSYIDEDPHTYYRLVQVDFDGKETIYNVAALDCDNMVISVYPNPFSDNTTLIASSDLFGTDIYIYDVTGALIEKKTIDKTKTIIEINEVGIYIMSFKIGDKVITKKLIKL